MRSENSTSGALAAALEMTRRWNKPWLCLLWPIFPHEYTMALVLDQVPFHRLDCLIVVVVHLRSQYLHVAEIGSGSLRGGALGIPSASDGNQIQP
jgi:hypothetical protein